MSGRRLSIATRDISDLKKHATGVVAGKSGEVVELCCRSAHAELSFQGVSAAKPDRKGLSPRRGSRGLV